MKTLLRFAINTEPMTWAWMFLLTGLNTYWQFTGESHWVAWVALAVIYATLLMGAEGHRRRLAKLKAQHNKEAVDFANHILNNRNKMSIAPITDVDLMRYRKFRSA